MAVSSEAPKLSPKDFASNQDVRWCPGCGDYSILAQVKKVFATLGIEKENTVFVSGIGCSSRFPYYMNTYGIHGIHGRAPAIAAGLKISRPELSVWVVTGDGDGLSIGGNHLIHAIRRNLDINILLFNNKIYGLTKGQYSPTSEFGKKTKSTPVGSIDYPIRPLSLAIGAEAAFVARSIDVHVKHLSGVLEAAARHKGTSFVEIYQNCNIFNDGAYLYAADRSQRAGNTVELEHGQPLKFGKNKEKGIMWNNGKLEVVTIGEDGITEDDLLVHDETLEEPAMAFLLSRMTYPKFPEALGILRKVEHPTYEDLAVEQIRSAQETLGNGELESLFHSGETWVVD